MNRIEVTLIGVNKEGKTCMSVVETESLLGAVRIVMTGKVKRGYKLVKYVIEEKDVLV